MKRINEMPIFNIGDLVQINPDSKQLFLNHYNKPDVAEIVGSVVSVHDNGHGTPVYTLDVYRRDTGDVAQVGENHLELVS
jgi:hypothetical protein